MRRLWSLTNVICVGRPVNAVLGGTGASRRRDEHWPGQRRPRGHNSNYMDCRVMLPVTKDEPMFGGKLVCRSVKVTPPITNQKTHREDVTTKH